MIRLLSLGGLAIQRETDKGSDARLASSKRNALLAYLAVQRPNGGHARDTLMALFWPESDDRHARDALNQLIRSLRQDLGDELFVPDRGSGIELDDSQVWCDAVALSKASEQGEHAKVLELYRGDFLEGFHLNGSVEFEEWVFSQRNRLRERVVTSGKLLAATQEQEKEHDAALHTMKRLLELQPYDESCIRTLMRLHLYAGERGRAVAAYETYAELLATEFDASPSAETVTLLEEARTRVIVRGDPKVVIIDPPDVAPVVPLPVGAADGASASTDSGLQHGQGMATRAGAPRRARQGAVLLGTGMLLAVVGVSVWSARRPDAAPAELVRFSIVPLESAPLNFGNNSQDLAISPDGRVIVYKGPNPAGTGWQLNLQSIDEFVATPLRGAETHSGASPFFSPDGDWVGFQASGWVLQKVSTSGGVPVTVTTSSHPIYGASWGADDQIIFGTGGTGGQATGAGLFRVPAGGGEPEQLTTIDLDRGEVYHLWPNHVSGREAVVFTITGQDPWDDAQLAVLDLRNGEIKRLGLAGSSPRYVSTGHLVYAHSDGWWTRGVFFGGSLHAVPFDTRSLEVTGSPVVLLEGMMVKNSSGANFSVSDNGHLIYIPAPQGGPPTWQWEFLWVDRQGKEEPLPLAPQRYRYPRLSPDGRRIAVGVRRGDTTSDLWVYDVATGTGLRLTHNDYQNGVPIWTPDGERIVFSSTRDAPRPASLPVPNSWWGNLYAVFADGSSEAERLTTSDESQAPTGSGITPDGQLLLYARQTGDRAPWEIMGMPVDQTADRTVLKSGPFSYGNATMSPDGRWLAYRSNDTGVWEVYVESFLGPGTKVPVSIGGGSKPVWSHDSRELFYRAAPANGGMLMAATIIGDATPQVSDRRPLFSAVDYEGAASASGPRNYHVAPDGRFLLLRRTDAESLDEWPPPPQINVVLNWFEELKERVPN